MVDLKKKAAAIKRQPLPTVKKQPAAKTTPTGPWLLPGLIIFLIALAVNLNTLSLDYALDDSLMITQNEITQKGMEGIPEIWSSDLFRGYFGKSGIETGGRYRPLAQTFFAMQVEFFGNNPVAGHFFNIICYALSCLLVYLLLSKLFPQGVSKNLVLSLPFVASLFYALHPLHVEAVANIKSLDEILSMLLSVSASLFVLRSFGQRKILNLCLGSLAFFLALTAKENALTFLAVIPLVLFYLKKETNTILLSLLPLVAVSILYFLLRSAALGPAPEIAWVDNFLTNPFFGASFLQKIATILMSWLKYLQLMIFPYPLTTDYYPAMIPVTGWSNPWVWLSFLFFAGIAAFALWKLPFRNKAAFGILYFFITFSVVSNLLINLGTPLNDRFLFMPLAGFCITIAYLLTEQLPRMIAAAQQRNVMAGVILLISLAYAGQTFSRNLDWKDDFTLFRHDIEISGNSSRCNVMTGKTYYEQAASLTDSVQKKEYLAKAVDYLRRGLDIYKGYYLAWGLLGVIEMDKENYRQSLNYFVECLKIEPTQGVALANLNFIGRKMLEKNDVEGCILSFRYLKQFAPEKPEAYQVLADVYSKTGKIDSALILLDQALKIDENNAMSWRLKGEIYATMLNNEVQAEQYFLRAISLDPNDFSALDNLGVAAFRKGNYKNAAEYFEQALRIQPTNAHLMTNLASTYSAMGDIVRANEYLQRAGQVKQ